MYSYTLPFILSPQSMYKFNNIYFNVTPFFIKLFYLIIIIATVEHVHKTFLD